MQLKRLINFCFSSFKVSVQSLTHEFLKDISKGVGYIPAIEKQLKHVQQLSPELQECFYRACLLESGSQSRPLFEYLMANNHLKDHPATIIEMNIILATKMVNDQAQQQKLLNEAKNLIKQINNPYMEAASTAQIEEAMGDLLLDKKQQEQAFKHFLASFEIMYNIHKSTMEQYSKNTYIKQAETLEMIQEGLKNSIQQVLRQASKVISASTSLNQDVTQNVISETFVQLEAYPFSASIIPMYYHYAINVVTFYFQNIQSQELLKMVNQFKNQAQIFFENKISEDQSIMHLVGWSYLTMIYYECQIQQKLEDIQVKLNQGIQNVCIHVEDLQSREIMRAWLKQQVLYQFKGLEIN